MFFDVESVCACKVITSKTQDSARINPGILLFSSQQTYSWKVSQKSWHLLFSYDVKSIPIST